jgi:hypothetical protein
MPLHSRQQASEHYLTPRPLSRLRSLRSPGRGCPNTHQHLRRERAICCMVAVSRLYHLGHRSHEGAYTRDRLCAANGLQAGPNLLGRSQSLVRQQRLGEPAGRARHNAVIACSKPERNAVVGCGKPEHNAAITCQGTPFPVSGANEVGTGGGGLGNAPTLADVSGKALEESSSSHSLAPTVMSAKINSRTACSCA